MTTAPTPLRPAPAENGSSSETLTVARARLIADWATARERAQSYAQALGLPANECSELAERAVEIAATRTEWREGDHVAETLRALRETITGPPRAGETDQQAFLRWRAEHAVGGDTNRDVCKLERLGSVPPIARRGMLPAHIERAFVRPKHTRKGLPPPEIARQQAARGKSREAREQRRRLAWTRAARRRRLVFMLLVLVPSIIASRFMLQVLPQHGGKGLEIAITLLFGALFGWISIGFWTALLGFFVLATRRDRFSLTQLVHADSGPLNAAARTALVMPVFEEPVERVFAGLYAIYRSLERTGHLDNFDLFILSDTADPDAWVREEQAWARLCRRVGGFGRIFYRRRRARIKRKSGNVAEFLRAWGNRYRYMVCLDADSIMAGNTIVSMVRAMERTPDAGMIQTAPTAFGRRSTFGRVHQFAMRLYGPMFTAGLHFWQLGDGQYWGHNAIIRIAPFMDHCGLGRLPGKPPLGGEILSHDFVEAALMGRAGWSLWLAYDLGGSWEQIPSSLLEEMKRDRRWCQGNLQHLRLVFTKGIFGAHRALFVNGALSYVSALLWFGFLVTSTVEAILNALHEPVYFPEGRSLFPQWPVWHADWALALLAVTGVILFASKLLAVALVAVKRQSKDFGGLIRLTFSVIVEIAVSSLFAPIRMVFHTRFVAMNLLGRTVVWKSGPREDSETGWGEALRHHGVDTVIATAWGIALFLLNPYYFFWILPVIGALVLSVPISVLASRVRVGDWVRRAGLFVIPEESNPPTELRDLDTEMHALHASKLAADGLLRAGVDPSVNALHRGLLGGPRRLRADIRAFRDALLTRALGDGAAELSSFERRVLLSDPECVDEIHRRAWSLPPAQAERWLADFRA